MKSTDLFETVQGLVMEKFTKAAESFEDSEERDIFQMWLFNNRTPYEDRHREFTNDVREVVHNELTEKKAA